MGTISGRASLPLLAELGPWRNLVGKFRGEYVQSGSSSLVTDLLIAAIVLAALSSIVYLGARHYYECRNRSARRLFYNLCQAHGLEPADRRLLLALARAQQLADPAELFVTPDRFDGKGASVVPREAEARLAALRCRLFSNVDESQAALAVADELAAVTAQVEASIAWNHPQPISG